jgi:hypothetical protein
MYKRKNHSRGFSGAPDHRCKFVATFLLNKKDEHGSVLTGNRRSIDVLSLRNNMVQSLREIEWKKAASSKQKVNSSVVTNKYLTICIRKVTELQRKEKVIQYLSLLE